MLLDFYCDILHEQEMRVFKGLLSMALDKFDYSCLSVDDVLHLFVNVEENVRRVVNSIEKCLKILTRYFHRLSALFESFFRQQADIGNLNVIIGLKLSIMLFDDRLFILLLLIERY